MLTNLLPGLREIRAPVISGYLWMAFFFLLLRTDLPSRQHPGSALRPVFELSDALSVVGVATVTGVAAYLIGSAMQEVLKLIARLVPVGRPLYAQPGTHVSARGMETLTSSVFVRAQGITRQLFQIAVSPGERGVDSQPRPDSVLNELPVVRTLLLGKHPELVGELDRLQAEADLRITVSAPIAALSLLLGVEAGKGWFLFLIPAILLVFQGLQRQREAGDFLAEVLRIGRVDAPSLTAFELSVESALESNKLEWQLKAEMGNGDARAAFRLGNLQAVAAEFADAISSLRFAADNGVAQAHVEIGRAYEQLGDPGAAERAYRDGVERNDRKARELLAVLLTRMGRGEEALKEGAPGDSDAKVEVGRVRSRLSAYRSRMREHDPKAALNLGLLLERQGESDDALEAFRQATVWDPNDAEAWTALGTAEHSRGAVNAAETAFRQAVDLLEKQFGRDHLSVASAAGNLATAMERLGCYDDARQLNERALAIEEKQLGSSHVNVALRLSNLGNALSSLGRHEEAVAMEERALEIRERTPGSTDLQVATTLINLGNAMIASGRYEEALDTQKRALSMLEQTPGHAPLEMFVVFENLGIALREVGRGEESEANLRRALDLAEASGDPFPPDRLAHCLRELATTLAARGRHDRALETIERSIAIQLDNLSPDHPQLARTLEVKADILDDLGKGPDARRTRLRVAEIRAHPSAGEDTDRRVGGIE